MTERISCEFSLIRYVPDVAKGEFVNIGVVLQRAGAANGGIPLVRFTRNWARVRCLHADADIELLENLEAEILSRLRLEGSQPRGGDTGKKILAQLADTLSNSIQLTEPRACLAEAMPLELDQLMRLYIEPIKVPVTRTRTGRALIVASMRDHFERGGVWNSMAKHIAAAQYTQRGDPLKIDCGYRPNGIIRMFHAVSLATDIEAAKSIAYTAPRLFAGVKQVADATLELTAVVEPIDIVTSNRESEAAELYEFGVRSMESENIRVITTNNLAAAAQTARTELRI